MIRVDLPDQTTTNQLIEALYVAAGSREGTLRATQWRRLARQVEAALDNLPPHPAPAVTPNRTNPDKEHK